MAESNGDYISRFERVERTLDALAKRQDKTQEQLDATDRQIDMLTRDMISMHTYMKDSKANVDNLVAAIRLLVDQIPPARLAI